MAKIDLIDRTALVAELEGLKAILGDVFLGMVVERAIERVKAQPVVLFGMDLAAASESTTATMGECLTCKHWQSPMTSEPCASCGLGCHRLGRNWEAADA